MAQNAIDIREQRLLARRTELEAAIHALTLRLADITDAHSLDTGAEDARHMGSQRITVMRSEIKAIDEQLAKLPFDESYPVAIGTDVIGNDIGEAVLS